MKKSKLKTEYLYDFGLLGISSIIKPHKLAWQLNTELSIRLVRKDDLLVMNKSDQPCYYANYLHETLLTTIRVFRNKPNEPESPKWVLVPEHPHCDYIIMFKSDTPDLGNRLHKTLKDIASVEWVAFLPLAALKSKDNFIF
jgi:hypothetical protein